MKNGIKSPTFEELQTKLQVLSAVTNRLKLAGRLGMSHQGTRDLYTTLGYPRHLSSSDFLSQWKRHDIARAVVDRPAKMTWQGDLYISESTEEDETVLEKEYKALEDRLALKSQFLRLDRLSQLGRYAVMLLGFDDSNQETWAQPVTPGERTLLYTKVVSQANAEISTWENDPSNERYGKPRIYKIKLTKPGTTDKQVTLNVHYTRIIHVAQDLLENDIEGTPVMETIFNRLKDIEKLVGGSAEMFWRGARPGYAGTAQDGYTIGEDSKKALQEQIQEYENDLRRILVTEGIELDSLAQQIADPKGHVEVQLQMISAATGIPLRILLGSERGELASSQDDNNWKEWIESRRLEMAEPFIVRPFVDRLIQFKALPEIKDEEEGYRVTWSNLFTMDDTTKAEIGAKRTTALNQYTSNPYAEQTVPLEGFLKYFLQMEDEEVEQLIELRDAEQIESERLEARIEAELNAQPTDTDTDPGTEDSELNED